MHQQEIPVVYTDQRLGEYPLRLSHLFCSTSGERKIDDIVGGSVTDSCLSIRLTHACTHIHRMYITIPPMYNIMYRCSHVYTYGDWKLIGRCVGLTEADLTTAIDGDDRTEEMAGHLSGWISTLYNTTIFGRNM